MAGKKQWSALEIIVVTVVGAVGVFLLVGVLGLMLFSIYSGGGGNPTPVVVTSVETPSHTG